MPKPKTEIEFAPGFFVKAPHPNAPDYVKLGISLRREEFLKFLTEKTGDWVNLEVKESRNGEKLYASVDYWEPQKKKEDGGDGLPF